MKHAGGEIFYVEFEIIGGYEGERIPLIIETSDSIDGLTITRNHGQIEILPQNTALLPNYPNPFNPETWIPFKLSKSADLYIRIFSDKGELLKTFALGLKDAGSYIDKTRAVYWDGRNDKGERVSSSDVLTLITCEIRFTNSEPVREMWGIECFTSFTTLPKR